MEENLEKENNNKSETSNDSELQSEVDNDTNTIDNEEGEKNIEEKEKSNEETLENLKIELEETKDKLLRALAESENIRKQMEKVRMETNKYGIQPLAREILNIADNFDRAMSVKNEENEKSIEGFSLIQKEFLSILEKFNINKINPLGQGFDANFHQAMFEKETEDYDEGQVCEIVQDGYTFHERLLRPALVGVAKKTITKEKDNEKEEIKHDKKD